MSGRVRAYTGEEIDVTYDAGRCIHVAECLRRLHDVFDTTRRPWILPDNATADDVAETVMACPSGALQFARKDGGVAEPLPATNTIRLAHNGPLFVRGDFTIVTPLGEVVLKETRASLCRCGASESKPFCDNSHRAIGFRAPYKPVENVPELPPIQGGPLTIVTRTNGSLHITGNFTVLDARGNSIYHGADNKFCRCGGSERKPFCDGTHALIGFVAE